MLKKCLIANRGEIAVRIINACRELGVGTVAVYSDADKTAQHVRMADEAYSLGGMSAAESYLRYELLIDVAKEAGCDCLHPGYGFLSEVADFAELVLEAGITWVGPSPDVIRQMGVKTEARTLMEAADVPLVPGFQSEDADDATFVEAANQIGYPIMVKAAGGGGGKGIRVVYAESELPNALESARREAQNAFGDARVFLEKYIESARHIEVQIIADTHGNVCHLYERECSTQRRHQKIIEETPSPILDDDTRHAICQTAVTAAESIGYVNAGTVEFIATESGEFYFLEMNTRLQVEHPVTEYVTGVDIVKTQLRIASGEALPFKQGDIRQQGHAIECRIYAEDAHNNFMPSIGKIHTFVPPSGPGVRVDSGIQSGDAVTIHYDPMIAKLIVYDRSRDDAIKRMKHALDETVILGTTTNIDFLETLLETEKFLNGEVDTGYVDANLDALMGTPEQQEIPDMALIALAVAESNRVQSVSISAVEGDMFSAWDKKDGFRL